MSARAFGAVATLMLFNTAVSAQTSAADNVIQSFQRCRSITTVEARLECFDKAASVLGNAVKNKEITIVDRQEVRQARRSLFGFTIPRLSLFGGDDRDETRSSRDAEFAELNTTIISATPIANGRVQLRLAEGDAVWSTTDPMPFPPKPGAKIRVKRGALGNYFLAIAGERSVRGVRIR
jgi:hypothetical protein